MEALTCLLLLFVYIVTICSSSQNPLKHSTCDTWIRPSDELASDPSKLKGVTGTAVILNDSANTYGAVCIDGTPPFYYYAIGAETKKYIVYFEGGGWCSGNSEAYGIGFDSCHKRSTTHLGSSSSYSKTTTFGGGQLDNNQTNNPLMYNWTMIYLPYCDGASFGGNRDKPDYVTSSGGTQIPLYSRGYRIMKAVYQDLLTNRGMIDATDIVISGCSAGGLATWLHSDWIKNNLLDGIVSNDCRISALPDSGYFIQYNGLNGATNYSNGMKWVFNNGNMSYGSIDSDCINNYGGQDNDQAYKCVFSQNIAPFVDVNLFALNSQFDEWQINEILGTTDSVSVNEYGQNFTELMYGQFFNGNDGTNNYNRAGFIDSCYHHCGDWDAFEVGGKNQATGHMEYYMNKVVGGSEQTYIYFQNNTYPCSSCCSS